MNERFEKMNVNVQSSNKSQNSKIRFLCDSDSGVCAADKLIDNMCAADKLIDNHVEVFNFNLQRGSWVYYILFTALLIVPYSAIQLFVGWGWGQTIPSLSFVTFFFVALSLTISTYLWYMYKGNGQPVLVWATCQLIEWGLWIARLIMVRIIMSLICYW